MQFPTQKEVLKRKSKIFILDFSSSYLQDVLKFKLEVTCILISGENDRKLDLLTPNVGNIKGI